jgi:hypothetical protein
MTRQRPQARLLASHLAEPRRFLHEVAGPRQVGKSTLVQEVVEASGLPHRIASADEPTLRRVEWVAQHWEAARLLTRSTYTLDQCASRNSCRKEDL